MNTMNNEVKLKGCPELFKRFRKKPVVIEAVQWSVTNAAEIAAFMMGGKYQHTHSNRVAIFTLEGTMIAAPGDWIIKGVKGEYYPCKPDIFEATYEAWNTRAQGGGKVGHATDNSEQLRKVSVRLSSIKQRVCGGSIPNWQDGYGTTASRIQIANACDEALAILRDMGLLTTD